MLEYLNSMCAFKLEIDIETSKNTDTIINKNYHETILKSAYPVEWCAYTVLKSIDPEMPLRTILRQMKYITNSPSIESVALPVLN